MKKIISTIFIIIGFLLVIAYLFTEGQSIIGGLGGLFVKKAWRGNFYESQTSPFTISETFKTSEECVKWAEEQALKSNAKDGEWKYTCGLNCKYTGRKQGSTTDNYECEQLLSDDLE